MPKKAIKPKARPKVSVKKLLKSKAIKAEVKKVVDLVEKEVEQILKDEKPVTARCPRCGEFKHAPTVECDAGV